MKKVVLYLFLSIQACQPVFAQSYLKGPALIEGVTVTATAAGTTTLTKDSQTVQTLTGSTTQTIILPDATTLPVGRYFEFYNLSSGAVTVNYNGGSLARTIIPSGHSKITLTANGTAAGDWAIEKITIAFSDSLLTGTLGVDKGGTGVASTTAYGVLAGGTTSTGALQNIGVGSSGQILTSNGAGVLPSFQAAPVSTTLTTKGDIQTYSTVNDRLGVGTNDQILIADSGATTGLNWANRDAANYLLNPSFEHTTATTSWTQGSGTSCAAETTEVSDGTKSLLCTLTAATAASVYQDVTPTVKMSGINFEYGVWIKTASTTLSVCARQAAATVGSCTTVIGDNVWHYYPINYPGPSSGSVGVSVVPLSSTTGTYYIDAGYVGKARNIGTVAQASFVGALKYAGVASCQWSTASTSFAAFAADTDCNTPTVTGSATAPGTKIPGVVFSNLAPGTYRVVANFGIGKTGTQDAVVSMALNDGTTTSAGKTFYNGIANGTVVAPATVEGYFTYTTAQSSVTFQVYGYSQNASNNAIIEMGNTNRDFEIAVEYFPSAAQTVVNMNQVRPPTIQKFTSGSGTYTVPVGVTHINVRMVGGGGGGAGGGTSGAGNGTAGGNTTFGTSLLAANGGSGGTGGQAAGASGGSASLGTGPIGTAVTGSGGGSPTGTGGTGLWASGGVGGISPFGGGSVPGTANLAGVAAIANSGSGGSGGGANTTASNISGAGGGAGGYVDAWINVGMAVWANTFSYSVGSSGGGGSAGGGSSSSGLAGGSGYIEVTEYYGNNMPLLVGGVTSNTSGMERVERARITGGTVNQTCASSPCTVYSQSGSWLSGVTRSSTGIYVFTFASGMFSALPSCVATGENGAQVLIFNLNVTSTTAMTVNVYDTSGTARDAYFNVNCQGPR